MYFIHNKFPRVFTGVLDTKHGWYQSHYVDFNVRHHVNRFRLPIPSLLSMIQSRAYKREEGMKLTILVQCASKNFYHYIRCYSRTSIIGHLGYRGRPDN